MKFPCLRALSIIGERCEQAYSYCPIYHMEECYLGSYAGNIVPLGDYIEWKVDNFICRVEIILPVSNRQLGRPMKMKRRSRMEMLQSTKC